MVNFHRKPNKKPAWRTDYRCGCVCSVLQHVGAFSSCTQCHLMTNFNVLFRVKPNGPKRPQMAPNISGKHINTHCDHMSGRKWMKMIPNEFTHMLCISQSKLHDFLQTLDSAYPKKVSYFSKIPLVRNASGKWQVCGERSCVSWLECSCVWLTPVHASHTCTDEKKSSENAKFLVKFTIKHKIYWSCCNTKTVYWNPCKSALSCSMETR